MRPAELPLGLVVDRVLVSRPDRLVARARREGEAPVVVKASLLGARWSSRSALRREARVLDTARGDGVVELVDVVDRRGVTALLLGLVPGRSVGERPVPDRQAVAERLRRTVDRLHDRAVAHGALRAEHVLLDADGLPVLVGFGSARPVAPSRAGAVDGPPFDSTALATLLRSIRAGG